MVIYSASDLAFRKRIAALRRYQGHYILGDEQYQDVRPRIDA